MASSKTIEGLTLGRGVPPLPAGPINLPCTDGSKISLSDDMASRHTLVIGGIGSGKTVAISHILRSVQETMTEKDVAVIFDPKGDYVRQFRRPQDHVVNDLDRATDVNPWSVTAELLASRLDYEETLQELGATLFEDAIRRTMQPFFPLAAKDIFCAVLDVLVKQGADNSFIRRMWERLPLAELRKVLPEGVAQYIAKDDSGQTQGIISELFQIVHALFVGRFAHKGTWSIRQALREKGGRCLFLEYDVSMANVLLAPYRVLVDLAIKEAISRHRVEGRVFFFLDEFRRLPRLLHIDSGVNFGRSLGARFVLGVQSVSQVRSAYEQEGDSILSGLSNIIAFRAGDEESREYLKGRFGMARKLVWGQPNVGPLREEIATGYVMEDWDILSLPVGEVICSLWSVPPPFTATLDPYPM